MEVVQDGPMTFRLRPVALPYLSSIFAKEEAREHGERQPTPVLETLRLPELRLFERLRDGEDVATIQDKSLCKTSSVLAS